MAIPARTREAADRWQGRLDEVILATAVLAILGVALQTAAKHGPVHAVGLIAAILAWMVFVADAAVMLTVSPEPYRWARGHAFELVLLPLTCPLWPILVPRLLALELLPAFTVLEAAKFAKLAKVTYRLRRSGRVARTVILIGALVVAVFVLFRT